MDVFVFFPSLSTQVKTKFSFIYLLYNTVKWFKSCLETIDLKPVFSFDNLYY